MTGVNEWAHANKAQPGVCDACRFETLVAVFQGRDRFVAPRDVKLCELCSTSPLGNHALYPAFESRPGDTESVRRELLQTIGYVGNAILFAIKTQNR